MASFISEKNGLFQVQIEGLKETIENLRTVNAKGANIVEKAIQDSGSSVLSTARSKASVIALTGAFGSSLSIKKTKSGIFLRSNDEAAGVIEFAKHGAKTRTSKGTPRADARLRKHSGVGVPRRASNPRVLVPAVNENVLRIQDAVATALERALNGNR